MSKQGQITDRQERFCQEYMIDLNATQAAIRAGYAKSSADVRGAELVRNSKVVVRIDALKAKLQIRTERTQADIIQELEYLAFGRITDVVSVENIELSDDGDTTLYTTNVTVMDTDSWTDASSACVESIAQTKDGIRLKMYNKLDALGRLMEYHGMNGEGDNGEEQSNTVKFVQGEKP